MNQYSKSKTKVEGSKPKPSKPLMKSHTQIEKKITLLDVFLDESLSNLEKVNFIRKQDLI